MQLSIFETKISPFVQAGIVLACMAVFMGMGTIGSKDPRFPWVTVCAMLLFFAIFNSLLSIPAKELGTYYWKSIVSFVVLAILGGFLAYGVSGISINEAGSARWLYVVFALGYLVFISIIQMIKFIIALAQKQDKGLRGEN